MPRIGCRIVVGIPTTAGARRSDDWIECLNALQYPLGSTAGRLRVVDRPIADARNELCRQALEANAEYLVFLGDDVLPPANMILTMLDKIDRVFPQGRCDLLTGVYWTKGYPSEPYLWNGMLKGTYRDWTAGEFFPVDLAGCDALMIPTRVLRALPKPWFSTDWVWESDQNQKPGPLTTEDFYFFTKARRAGFRLWADTSIQCLHEDRQTGWHFGLSMDMRQAGGQPSTPDGVSLRVAELGAGLWAPAYGDQTTVVRFDLREDVKPDVRCDVRHLPEQYFGQFDIVHASHILEHFRGVEAPQLIRHWTNLLKPGGELRIRVPNVTRAMRSIVAWEDGLHDGDGSITPASRQYDWQQLYGDQREPGPAHEHLNGFTARKLRNLLAMHPGLDDIEVVTTHEGGALDINLLATARLARVETPPALVDWWDEIETAEAAATMPRGGAETALAAYEAPAEYSAAQAANGRAEHASCVRCGATRNGAPRTEPCPAAVTGTVRHLWTWEREPVGAVEND